MVHVPPAKEKGAPLLPPACCRRRLHALLAMRLLVERGRGRARRGRKQRFGERPARRTRTSREALPCFSCFARCRGQHAASFSLSAQASGASPHEEVSFSPQVLSALPARRRFSPPAAGRSGACKAPRSRVFGSRCRRGAPGKAVTGAVIVGSGTPTRPRTPSARAPRAARNGGAGVTRQRARLLGGSGGPPAAAGQRAGEAAPANQRPAADAAASRRRSGASGLVPFYA